MFIQLTLCLSYKFKDSFLFVFYIGSVHAFATEQISNEFGLCSCPFTCCTVSQVSHLLSFIMDAMASWNTPPYGIMYYNIAR